MNKDAFPMPDYVVEVSWEVCNKVGGIYTVLSTRANTLQAKLGDNLIFIGPDVWEGKENPYFTEDKTIYADWTAHAAAEENLKIRAGRWNIPGKPVVFLVDFSSYYAEKNDIYYHAWQDFGVDSLHAYGDYDEASMFSYAAGRAMESFYRYNIKGGKKVVYQAHEWMTGLGALYLQKRVPEIATIFTTHATSIGRSIAGNNKPLYDYLFSYNGDQMARELNMEAKHSIEKQTAHHVDCFTTVSDLTDQECRVLLEKSVDVVLKNGFEKGFVPRGTAFVSRRKQARKSILTIASALMGETFEDENTLIIGTSGRYEFKNKGIDLFLESMNNLNRRKDVPKKVLAVVAVPAYSAGPRQDLKERLLSGETNFQTPLEMNYLTHYLHNLNEDRLTGMLHNLQLHNRKEDNVKLIFIPCYLDGKDGIVDKSYYDTLIGFDLTVYPSYYEPWGYTPLESIAFHIPTVSTNLAGFGLWINSLGMGSSIDDGTAIVRRSDYNYFEAAENITEIVLSFSRKDEKETKEIRRKAKDTAEKALWKNFILQYYEAYDIALRRAAERMRALEEELPDETHES